MPEKSLPEFGRLLKPFIDSVAPSAVPGFLAMLERGAAERYRHWADVAATAEQDLHACAAREDEIAARVERLLPLDSEQRGKALAALPGARKAYYAVFADLPLREQFRLQAGAERQGASAWRLLAAQQDDAAVRDELHTCAELEEESARCLDEMVRDPAAFLE